MQKGSEGEEAMLYVVRTTKEDDKTPLAQLETLLLCQ